MLTGTSSIVGISTHDASAVADQLLTIPTACAPLRVLYGPTQSSGASIDWLGQLLQMSVGEVLELAGRVTARHILTRLP